MIGLKLLKLGALVKISARRIGIAFASARPYAQEWRLAAARLASARLANLTAPPRRDNARQNLGPPEKQSTLSTKFNARPRHPQSRPTNPTWWRWRRRAAAAHDPVAAGFCGLFAHAQNRLAEVKANRDEPRGDRDQSPRWRTIR
jgi:hypothetical protein